MLQYVIRVPSVLKNIYLFIKTERQKAQEREQPGAGQGWGGQREREAVSPL